MSRRAMVGGVIIAAWLGGLAVLVHREYYRPQVERLADAALRVSPGGVFYGASRGGANVGFASSTIDTAHSTITIEDYLVANSGPGTPRTVTRTRVALSRGFAMSAFDLVFASGGMGTSASGRLNGDSLLTLIVAGSSAKTDTQRIHLNGPVILPSLLPLALALTETPKVGKHYVFPVFDPVSRATTNVALDIRAESLFVVNDSAVFDSTKMEWRGIQPDTVRAWQVAGPATTGFNGWVDQQGRVVATAQMGLALQRLPYEVAFENWRIRNGEAARGVVPPRRVRVAGPAPNDRSIIPF